MTQRSKMKPIPWTHEQGLRQMLETLSKVPVQSVETQLKNLLSAKKTKRGSMNKQGFVGVLAAVFIGLFSALAGWIAGSKSPSLLNGQTVETAK